MLDRDSQREISPNNGHMYPRAEIYCAIGTQTLGEVLKAHFQVNSSRKEKKLIFPAEREKDFELNLMFSLSFKIRFFFKGGGGRKEKLTFLFCDDNPFGIQPFFHCFRKNPQINLSTQKILVSCDSSQCSCLILFFVTFLSCLFSSNICCYCPFRKAMIR